jgi:thiol-disulfide isomerase/thioredoxin
MNGMKFRSISILVAVVLSISFCKSQVTNSTLQRTVLCGKTADSIKSIKIIVVREDTIVRNAHDYSNFEVAVVGGKFHFNIDVNYPIYLIPTTVVNMSIIDLFGVGSTRYTPWGILLEPGDSVFTDAYNRINTNFENISFSGRGSDKLICIQDIIRKSKSFLWPIAKENVDRFSLVDSVNFMIDSIVNSFGGRISQLSKTIIRSQYITMASLDVSEYIMGGQRINLERKRITDPKIIKILEERTQEADRLIDMNNANLIFSPNINYPSKLIKRILVNYVTRKAVSPIYTYMDNFDIKREYYDVLSEALRNVPIRNKALGLFIKEGLNHYGLNEEIEGIILKYLESSSTKDKYYSSIQTMYDWYKNGSLSAGTPAFTMPLFDLNGNHFSLSSLKGKIVLIDFMFTGCVGCKSMVPKLKKVEEHFQGINDIAFASISADTKASIGKEYMAKGEFYFVPESVYLYVGNEGFEHPILKYYHIASYPTLIIIDKNGRLITSKAPDPRFDNGFKLTELLEAVLSK